MEQTTLLTGAEQSLLDGKYIEALPYYNPGVGIVVRYRDMRILYVNQQFEHYLGFSNSDLIGEGLYFSSLLEDYQHDRLLSQLKNVESGAEARSSYFIYRLKNKNNKFTSFYLYASPLPDHDVHGKLYYLLLQPDLSEWGMPFTSIDSKEMFLEQFESEHFGTFEWITDIDKIFVSSGIYRIFEIDDVHREINMSYAETFVHPKDIESLKKMTGEAIKTDANLNTEFRIITAKQQVKLMHVIARIIKDKNGHPLKFAGSLRDITHQKNIADSLKNKIEELHHSNRELEEFAFIASHDLQEPLRKITTFSDRLLEKYKDTLTGDGNLYLSRIVASAENMRTLISNLLEFSRVAKTSQPFEQVNLDISLREVKSDLELLIEDSGTVINASPLPTVHAVSSQMKQLLENIIGNAIKFRKHGVSPQIDIETSLLDTDEKLKYELNPTIPYYKITITDNGIGFENEYANRIFQIFQRLHGKADYPGTGIGLAICKKIVEYHRGVIYGENIPDRGARFTFILPQYQEAGIK
jgi:signal transduction histidine kinase